MVSLAEKKRGFKVKGERFDSRVALYLRKSDRIAMELIAEARRVSLCDLLRGYIDAGRKSADEGKNNE